MGRPTTKNDLIKLADENFEKLWNLINSFEDEGGKVEFDFSRDEKKKEAHWARDKNLRDVLIHLYEWHILLLNWIDSNTKGEEKQFLLEGYNWKTYGEMNIIFWEKHQETSLKDSKEMIKESHFKLMKIIDGFSNEELFSKGVYKWTGGTTLGSYCVSTTSSHYDWAIKKLKAYKKTLKNK